jgi:uncharacterized membrane protein
MQKIIIIGKNGDVDSISYCTNQKINMRSSNSLLSTFITEFRSQLIISVQNWCIGKIRQFFFYYYILRQITISHNVLHIGLCVNMWRGGG